MGAFTIFILASVQFLLTVILLQPNHILLLLHNLAQSLPHPEIFPHYPSSLLYLCVGVPQVNCLVSFSHAAPRVGQIDLAFPSRCPVPCSGGAPRGSGATVSECCPLTLTAHLQRCAWERRSGRCTQELRQTLQPGSHPQRF